MPVMRIEKMDKICIGFFLVLSLSYCRSEKTYKPGEQVVVDCHPKESGTLTFWFQINGNVAHYLLNNKKTNVDERIQFIREGRISIKSFNKKTDSGLYTCASMNKNQLSFGEVTAVKGEPDSTPTPKPALITPKPVEVITTTKCPKCKNELKPVLMCETWILSSMACGCGLLLILLIFTILYCNRLRTRRCPHHYKRKPQPRPAGHAKLPNTHF